MSVSSEAPRGNPKSAPLAFAFDRDLARKYDRSGPRYTSYPTVPNFLESFGEEEYLALVREGASDLRPLSLYVHIPFCRHRCFFCGCNVVITRSQVRAREYLPLLEREAATLASPAWAEQREVVQVHWGGGTPTFLEPDELTRLSTILRQHFRIAPGAEIGVEVDPRECTEEHLDALAEAGMNRLSAGLQDLDPRVQEAVNRLQSAEETARVVEGARRRGVESVNLDLIYGLPHQTPESFLASLERVLEMEPDRLAVFNFAYLPEMFKHQRVLDREALPTAEVRLAILETAVWRLAEAGYVFIGMDHFARPDDSLVEALREGRLTRNFQGYSTFEEVDLLGFGVSAISQVAGGYAQNRRRLGDYTEAVRTSGLATFRGHRPSVEDRLRRDVILALMCDFRVDKTAIEDRHGVLFDRHFARELQALARMADDGLVEVGRDTIEVTPVGRLLVRNLAMAFDAYLDKGRPAAFSRTV